MRTRAGSPPSAPPRPRAPPTPRTACWTSRSPPRGLAYQFADAEAEAGSVQSPPRTRRPVDHDIAVEGNGVNDKGEVVTNGGVSEFTADLEPGEYTFFCSVPGHREGGMEGKLTVE